MLLKELNDQRCALPRRGSGRAPIELSDWPSLSGLDERVVLGGFEVLWAAGTAVPLGEDALRHYAAKERLRLEDAVAIVLGRVPPVQGVPASPAYLASLDPGVKQLMEDVERARFSVPCWPVALARWSLTADVRLPQEFRQAVVAIAYAAAEVAAESADAAPRVQPALTIDELREPDPELQQRANAIAQELKKKWNGRWPTKNRVAKEQAREDGRTEGNILRRIRKEWGAGPRRNPKSTRVATVQHQNQQRARARQIGNQ